jgi:hypothetical protein
VTLASKLKLSANSALLLLILIVATVLRFWNFPNMPYMHDELSALGRLQYNSVQDVITYGVMINDTHPPGVQLFLYYWTRLFGTNEMIVKFPFIICGLLSIVLAYKISKNWFNDTVALLVSSFMAVMQYMITYSELARPYSTGVFFCLALVFCWNKFLFESTHYKKWIAGFIFSAVCCAYNHHFSLLFAFIVGLSGIPFLKKENWKIYLFAGVIVCILYLPNVPVLLFQMSKGGLGGDGGWLNKPDSGWLYRYLKYTFHFSYWMYALVFSLIFLSIIWYNKEMGRANKYRMFCILWFFSFFFIQYFYSIYVSAIIQFSTLIFVYPFFLMFLFSLFSALSVKKNLVLVVMVLTIGTTSLIAQRKHFQIFYHQPYQQQITTTYESLKKIKDPSDATIELIIPPYLKNILKKHYLEKEKAKFDQTHYGPINQHPTPKAFRSFVYSRATHYFIAADLPMEYIEIIKEKYPYMISKEEGFTYSNYCFAKDKPEIPEIHEKILISQPLLLKKNTMDSTEEYGQGFSFSFKDNIFSRHTIVIVSAELSTQDTLSNPLLIANVEQDGESIAWGGAEYLKFNNNKNGKNRLYLSYPLTSFDFKKYPNAQMKIYIWNKDKKPLYVDKMKLEVIKGNSRIYGLYEPLD